MNLSAIAQATGGTAVTSGKYAFDDEAKKVLESFGFRMTNPDEASIMIGKLVQLRIVLDENQNEFYISLWFRDRSDKELNLGNHPLASLSEKFLASVMKAGKVVDAGVTALDGSAS